MHRLDENVLCWGETIEKERQNGAKQVNQTTKRLHCLRSHMLVQSKMQKETGYDVLLSLAALGTMTSRVELRLVAWRALFWLDLE
jgi:hypothetical protein